MTDLIKSKTPAKNCCVEIWGIGFNPNKCSRKGWYEHDGKYYCRQHHPLTLDEKHQKRVEKRKIEKADFDRKFAIRMHKQSAESIVEQIASGYENPKELAKAYVERLDYLKNLTINDYLKGKTDEI